MMDRTINLPLTENQLVWVMLIGFPILALVSWVVYLSFPLKGYSELAIVTLIVTGVVVSLVMWFLKIEGWYHEGLFPSIRCKDDD